MHRTFAFDQWVPFNRDRLVGVVLHDVFKDLFLVQRLTSFIVTQQPYPRRLIIFVVGDADVVTTALHHGIGGFGHTDKCSGLVGVSFG